MTKKEFYFSFKSLLTRTTFSSLPQVAVNYISPYDLEKQVTGQRSFIVYGSEIFRLYIKMVNSRVLTVSKPIHHFYAIYSRSISTGVGEHESSRLQ